MGIFIIMCDELQDFSPDSSTYLNQNYTEHHFHSVGDDETFSFFIRTKKEKTVHNCSKATTYKSRNCDWLLIGSTRVFELTPQVQFESLDC